jgi:hypothetical protein
MDLASHGAKALSSAGQPCVDTDHGLGGSSETSPHSLPSN